MLQIYIKNNLTNITGLKMSTSYGISVERVVKGDARQERSLQQVRLSIEQRHGAPNNRDSWFSGEDYMIFYVVNLASRLLCIPATCGHLQPYFQSREKIGEIGSANRNLLSVAAGRTKGYKMILERKATRLLYRKSPKGRGRLPASGNWSDSSLSLRGFF